MPSDNPPNQPEQNRIIEPVQNIPQQPVNPQPPAPPAQNSPMYAGFFLRNAALFLDTWIASIPALLISALITLPIALISGEPLSQAFGKRPISIIFNSLAVILTWSYFVFTTYKFGATLGKKAFKLQVISENGEPLTLGKAIVREIPGKIISGLILGIGYLMVAFSKEKQGLHDHLAGTHVIRTEPVTGRTKIAIALISLLPLIVMIAAVSIAVFAYSSIHKTSDQYLKTTYNVPPGKKISNSDSKDSVSIAALSRDQQRKADISNLGTEILGYQVSSTNKGLFPNSLNDLLVPDPLSVNQMTKLPLPPEKSDPPDTYGYKKCAVNGKEEFILYSKLEANNHYWVFKSKSAENSNPDSGNSEIPICP